MNRHGLFLALIVAAGLSLHGAPARAAAPAEGHGMGFQGMGADALDCLLCDEVSDPAPLTRLLGRPLTTLDEAVATALRGTSAKAGE